MPLFLLKLDKPGWAHARDIVVNRGSSWLVFLIEEEECSQQLLLLAALCSAGTADVSLMPKDPIGTSFSKVPEISRSWKDSFSLLLANFRPLLDYIVDSSLRFAVALCQQNRWLIRKLLWGSEQSWNSNVDGIVIDGRFVDLGLSLLGRENDHINKNFSSVDCGIFGE